MKENLLVSGLAFQSDVREVNENHEYEFIQEGTVSKITINVFYIFINNLYLLGNN